MKLFCKKALSVFLSLIMVFSVFAILDFHPLSITADAATPDDAVNGGLVAYFSTSDQYNDNARPNILYVDSGRANEIASLPYYFHVANKSDLKATILKVENTDILNWNMASTQLSSSTPSGHPNHERNRLANGNALLSLSNGAVLDFSVTYTLENVYDENGALVQFTAPCYIGVWNTSKDSKETASFDLNSGSSNKVGITNQFQTDKGILESVNISDTNSMTANYYIDKTGQNYKNWQDVGFRMYAKKNVDVRHHFQNTNQTNECGTIYLNTYGSTFTNRTASLSMTDFQNINGSWSGPYSNLTMPDSNYVASSGNNYQAKRLWEPLSGNGYATLWDKNDYGWLPFVGEMFVQNSSSAATIKLQGMRWNTYNNSNKATFTITFNCYIFDKTNLINYINNNSALLSKRYESTSWNNYTSKLYAAAQVLANQKANQGMINEALSNLQNAYNGLKLNNKVVKVTHNKYNGDMSGTPTTTSRYILAHLGNPPFIPEYYNSYMSNASNSRHTIKENLSKTYNSGTGLDTMTLNYWTINEETIRDAINAINEVLDHTEAPEEGGLYYHNVNGDHYIEELEEARAQFQAWMDGTDIPEYNSDVLNKYNELLKGHLSDYEKEKHSTNVVWKYITYDLNLAGRVGKPTIAGLDPSEYAKGYYTVRLESDENTYTNVKTPELAGYTFGGWYIKNSDGTETPIGEGSVARDGHVTVYAKWTPIEYTVTYFLDGGESSDNFGSDTYTIESEAVSVPEVSKTGYTFNGWKVMIISNDNGNWNRNDVFTGIFREKMGSITVIAVWSPNTYTIHLNGGSVVGTTIPPQNDITISYGNTIGLPDLSSLTVPGYVYDGWYDDTTGTKYTGGETYNLTRDLYLTAHWNAIEYTAHFNKGYDNADDFLEQPYTIEGLSVPAISRAGYNFTGWKVTKVGNVSGNWFVGRIHNSLPYTGGYGDVWFEAQWSNVEYTVQFDLNAENTVTKNAQCDGIENGMTVQFDVVPGALPVPTLAAYDFIGWYTAPEGGSKVDENSPWSITPDENDEIILYAHWAPTTYHAIFSAADGSIEGKGSTYTIDYTIEESNFTFPTASRDDATFAGWLTEGNVNNGGNWGDGVYGKLDGSGVAVPSNPYGNVTFTAVWDLDHEHDWSNWKPANDGLRHYRDCPLCGNREYAEHAYAADEIIDPSCTAEGYTRHICRDCDYELRDNYQDPLGHDIDENGTPENSQAPTCTASGWKDFRCGRCDELIRVIVPATGHTYGDPIVTPPTCTEYGYSTYKCTVCHEETQDNYVSPLGHNYTITVVEATCTTGGYTEYYCKRCGYQETNNVVGPLGHNYYVTVIEPTCTTAGYTSYYCILCGDYYTDSATDALGHDYRDTTVPPTCTEQGYDAHECSRCGIGYRDNYVPATGHNYREVERVPATNTRSGYILYKCEWCSSGYKETIYSGGKALVCLTLYGYDGRYLPGAKIVATNIQTGEKINITTDLNGYFTYIFPEGDYQLAIHADLYKDEICYLFIEAGKATICDSNGKYLFDEALGLPALPILQPAECDCLCHQTSIWAKIYRILYKLLKLFNPDAKCCPDTDI